MSDKKLASLKVQRAVLIDQQERTTDFVEKESANASLAALELRLDHVEKQMIKFLDIQSQIEILSDDELKASTRASYEEFYFSQQPALSTLIRKHKQDQSQLQDQSQIKGNSTIKSNVRLPKISLPTFSGDVTQWTNYFETFKVLIHEEQSLSNLHKYQYLKSTLTGSAAAQVAALEINDSNYTVALDLLKNKYGDTKIICQTHIEHLLNIKSLSASKPEHIRNFVDNTNVQLRALEALGRPVKQWDDVLVHLILQKLDTTLRSAWEDKAPESRLPTLQELLTFLTKKSEKIEVTRKGQNNSTMTGGMRSYTSTRTTLVTSKSLHCTLCKKSGHAINKCRTFINMSLNNKLRQIEDLKLCTNCLREHSDEECKSLYTCQVCKARHHTLIHHETNAAQDNDPSQPSTSSQGNQISLHAIQPRFGNLSYVFMPTAIVNIRDVRGNLFPCRAILDSASQLNFVSERMVQQLGLRKRKTSTLINGIGDESTVTSNYQTHLNISSRHNNFTAELDAVILPNITAFQPSSEIKTRSWKIPKNLQLSDPEFYKPNRVDLLIGAELHFQLLQVGQIFLGKTLPILQKTTLGWILAGKTSTECTSRYSCNLVSTASKENENESLLEILKKFWELETCTNVVPSRTREEKQCEIHFEEHYSRNSCGRIVVKIPFRRNPSCLGDSVQSATRRFFNLERRLHKDKELLNQYRNFIEEYVLLKHMTKLEDNELSTIRYVMPHHCVVKPDSSSTKLRVVFDASAKSTSNYSLNDIMMVGPVVQQDLFNIMLKFRKHHIAITADVCKMYRQILVDPQDCTYQNIVWREHPSHKLEFYQLQTVTYGTAAAPFLATRALLQLALDAQNSHPIGADVIKHDFYVDDLISGSETILEARELRKQVIEILQSGGMELRKWCSNSMEFLEEVPDELRENSLQFHESDTVKTLGLSWQPQVDKFTFKVNLRDNKGRRTTKRTVLADIGSLFDPMGFINPVVVLGKVFMQQLWKLKLNWDESLPIEFFTSWDKYRQQLHLLESFQITRRLQSFHRVINTQLHAFADASERAYGCCLYLRCVDDSDNISVSLVCAKSRVAPIKHTTIPRLELCAAQLLAQLTTRVKAILNIGVNSTFYWTDSKIVLSWLSEPSSTWSTFVANRVANIQELSSVESWHHVESENNPADLVSRGMLPEEFLKSKIWLNGPKFLHDLQLEQKHLHNRVIHERVSPPERRKVRLAFVACEERDIVQAGKYINSFTKLQNTFVYILRFVKNSRLPSSSRHLTSITPEERHAALMAIIKIVQRSAFADDQNSLKRYGSVTTHSSLKTLCPFLDSDGFLRVGGRIENANIPYNAKHPILLPSSHQFTKTLMTHLHYKNLHAGPQALLAATRQQFWPIKGGSLAKQIVHSCIRCFRSKPKDIQQLMGNLPVQRVQPSRPFVNSGVDFCGPFFTHYKIRGKQPTKTYIAVFICFATKAVHLELASDLTSAAFLATLRRFIGRRGLCANLYCDNATNFIGANSALKELRDIFLKEETRNEIIEMCSKDYISFHFIPPRSPHFGGLWEAAVKSAKYHLRRVVQGHSLTFEELSTLVIQIEAILNSRPIQTMSSDPNDLTALTPGHFLIGEPLTAIIEPNSKELRLSTLSRWQRIQWAQQQFWNRWSTSYLTQLQCRNKWNLPASNLTVGRLVLVKEDNLPAMKWILGRVQCVFEGDDGKVRVASVKTANGLIKRSVTKLCPLPMTIEN